MRLADALLKALESSGFEVSLSKEHRDGFLVVVGGQTMHVRLREMLRQLRVEGEYGERHALGLPLTWKKPQTIFVNSMSDLFHQEVPLDFIRRQMRYINRETTFPLIASS